MDQFLFILCLIVFNSPFFSLLLLFFVSFKFSNFLNSNRTLSIAARFLLFFVVYFIIDSLLTIMRSLRFEMAANSNLAVVSHFAQSFHIIKCNATAKIEHQDKSLYLNDLFFISFDLHVMSHYHKN